MHHTRAFRFPEAVAYGRSGNSAAIHRAIRQALANGQTVITASPKRGGGLHHCTIYPFRRKPTHTPLLRWPGPV